MESFEKSHPSLKFDAETGNGIQVSGYAEREIQLHTLDKAVVRAAINKHDRCGLVCDLKEMTHGNCAWNIRQELGLDLMDAPGLDKDGDA